MNFSRHKIFSSILIFLFCMVSYGEVISTFLPIYLNVNSTPFNVLFKGLYFGIALLTIVFGSKRLFKNKYHWTTWSLLMFVSFYSIRMFYDMFVEGIVFKGSVVNHLLFTYGANFIPFLALVLFAKVLDYNRLIFWTYLTLLISNLLAFLLVYKIAGTIGLDILSGRMSLSSEEGRGHNINAITLSMYGASLALVSFYYMFFKKEINTVLLIFSSLVGVLLLLVGASRGPQITFGLCFFYLFVVYIFYKRKAVISKIKFVSILWLFIILLIYIVSIIDLNKISMYRRFANFGEGAQSDTSTRELTWKLAWDMFVEHPIIGDCYVIYQIGTTYPHNIYLELLMSTGIIGALLFLPVVTKFFLSGIRNSNQVVVYLMFLIPIMSGLFSGSLFFNPRLFASFALMTVFSSIVGKSLMRN